MECEVVSVDIRRNFEIYCLWCYRATVGGSPFSGGKASFPPIEREGVVDMVTWQELFQFGIFLIALISLVIQANDKKK